MRGKKAMNEILIGIVIFYCLVLGYMYFNQRAMLYFPASSKPSYSVLGITAPEIVNISPEPSLTIEGWYWPPAKEGNETIVFFHGNGQAYQYWMDKLKLFRNAGFGTLHAEYRGYAGNAGQPTEQGLYADARAYIKWLEEHKNTKPENIILYGESLGTGVVVQMATEFPVKAIILESPYTSTAELGQSKYPIFPVMWLMKDQYRSIDKIAGLSMPKLIVHGELDQIIPIRFGRELYEKADEPKDFIEIKGAGHNDLYDHAAPLHVMQFLSTIAGGENSPETPIKDTE